MSAVKHASGGRDSQARKRKGSHRKDNEPFLMFTQTMARNPALLSISHSAAHILLVFYRAHIQASEEERTAFDMDRAWLVKLLKISRSTATRAIAELVRSRLIIKVGKRKLGGPCQYCLALPQDEASSEPPAPPDEDVEHNQRFTETDHTNPSNVLMGEPDNGLMERWVVRY